MPRFLPVLPATVAWQSICCYAVADGRVTALFPDSTGYDGRISRVTARDPPLREGHWRPIPGAAALWRPA